MVGTRPPVIPPFSIFSSSVRFIQCSPVPFSIRFYPTALKGCRGIVFTHGVRMGGRVGGWAAGNSLSGLYLRNRKV